MPKQDTDELKASFTIRMTIGTAQELRLYAVKQRLDRSAVVESAVKEFLKGKKGGK